MRNFRILFSPCRTSKVKLFDDRRRYAMICTVGTRSCHPPLGENVRKEASSQDFPGFVTTSLSTITTTKFNKFHHHPERSHRIQGLISSNYSRHKHSQASNCTNSIAQNRQRITTTASTHLQAAAILKITPSPTSRISSRRVRPYSSLNTCPQCLSAQSKYEGCSQSTTGPRGP